jgi:hypothetical protein
MHTGAVEGGGGGVFSTQALGTTQPTIQGAQGHSRGVKRPRSGADHPLHLAPRLNNE